MSIQILKTFAVRNEIRNDLMDACTIADVAAVAQLLEKDPSIIDSRSPVILNKFDDRYNRTAIMVCGLDPQFDTHRVDADCANITELLHKAGANIHLVDSYGWNIVALNAVRGFVKTIKYLIKNNVSYDLSDVEGISPIMKAVGHGHLSTFKLLLREGANLYATDKIGRTALHYAVLLAIHNESFVPFLYQVIKVIPIEAVNNSVDKNKRNILMYAAIENNIPVVEVILNYGANPGVMDEYGIKAADMSSNNVIQDLMRNASIKRIELDHKKWMDGLDKKVGFKIIEPV
eukprot:gene5538-7656_t